MLYAIIALLLVGLLGGGGYFYTRKPELAATSPFGDAMDAMDSATEQNMAGASKDIPNLDASSPQQWEENAVHWSRDANGNLSYYDAQSGQWVAYQG